MKAPYLSYENIAEILIDHLKSDKPNIFFGHCANGVSAQFTTWKEAMQWFEEITSTGYSYIYLATRIGTGIIMIEKTIEKTTHD